MRSMHASVYSVCIVLLKYSRLISVTPTVIGKFAVIWASWFLLRFMFNSAKEDTNVKGDKC